VGGSVGNGTGHGEGAAQILKIRGLPKEHDEFVAKLLLTLRGQLVRLSPSFPPSLAPSPIPLLV
jgi:hypothetical protein